MSEIKETLNICYHRYPMVPGDNVWSEDGKVFCLFPETHSPIHVGFLENLELYPGKVYWDLNDSGNGHEIRLTMKQQTNKLK